MTPEEQIRDAKRLDLKLKRQDYAASVQGILNGLPAPGKRAASFLRGMTKDERQSVLVALDEIDNLGGQP